MSVDFSLWSKAVYLILQSSKIIFFGAEVRDTVTSLTAKKAISKVTFFQILILCLSYSL